MLPPLEMLTTKNWHTGPGLLVAAWTAMAVLTGCTPAGPRALLEGERYLRAGKYPEAVARLQVATKLLPANAQAWNHLGLAYHYAGQPDPAMKAYEQARRLDLNLTPVRYNLGCLYLEQNEAQGAVAELTAFTLLERDSAEGWLKLGLAQLRARQFDGAERSLQRALQIRPNWPDAWNILGVVQTQRKRPREALNCFNLALQKQPGYGPAQLNVAVLHQWHLNNRNLALQKYQEYLDNQPGATNAEAVQDIVRQLRAEISPAKREPTNLVAQAPASHTSRPVEPPAASKPATNLLAAGAPTNASVPAKFAANQPRAKEPEIHSPAPADTSPTLPSVPVGASQSGPSNEPPSVRPEAKRSVATKPAEPLTPPPARKTEPEPPARTSVVQVAEEPPPKLAQDGSRIVSETPKAAAPATPAPVEQTSELLARQSGEKEPASEPREKRRLAEKLNPTTWFRGRRRTEEANLRSEGKESSVEAGSAASAAGANLASGGRRYQYLSPGKPAAGDRAKAVRHFNEGVMSHRDRRMAEAIAEYRQAIGLDPSYFEAQYNLGLAAYEMKDWAQSLSAYETALSINPTSANARYNFALALEQATYYQDAAIQFEQVIEQHPDETRAYLSVASLYVERLSRPDLARPRYRKVLELEPDHPQAHSIRYWLASNP